RASAGRARARVGRRGDHAREPPAAGRARRRRGPPPVRGMRPLWKGLVTFGLVSVPVGLYSATRRQAELHFRLLHEKDQAPIDYRRFCTEEDVEVDWKDIVKGYEYEKGRFVVVTDEDFERARVAGTHTIEIRDFVPAGDIDFAYFETPYWLGPGRAGAQGLPASAPGARGERPRGHRDHRHHGARAPPRAPSRRAGPG